MPDLNERCGSPTPPLHDDLLDGAAAITAFLWGDQAPRSKAYHAIESGGLPTFKIGSRIYARKSTVLAWIRAQEDRAGQREAA